MVKQKTAVLLPTALRPDWLKRCLDSLFTSGPLPDRIIVSPFEHDEFSIALLKDYAVTVAPRVTGQYPLGSVFGWNYCYSFTDGMDHVVLGADDLIFRYGWLGEALSMMESIGGSGLVALNDGSSDGNLYAAHWMASKQFLRDYVGDHAYPPMYRSWWCDRELTDIAQAKGCYGFAKNAHVDHLNYTFGLSEVDATYRGAMSNYDNDERIYLERKRRGFPVTWQGTIYHDQDMDGITPPA